MVSEEVAETSQTNILVLYRVSSLYIYTVCFYLRNETRQVWKWAFKQNFLEYFSYFLGLNNFLRHEET